jgi:hypothetical protein
MTEQVPPLGPSDDPQPEASADPVPETRTGVPGVDEVLGEIDRLDELPLEEHLAAFERAHESLRAALDAPPMDRPDDPA